MNQFDIIANAKAEIARLNCQLRDLHLEEERCRLRRSRLEGELTRINAFVDGCELAQRFGAATAEPSVFHFEPVDPNQPNGARLVTVAAKEPLSRHKRKPDGIPPMPRMIAEALRNGAVHGRAELAPAAIAAFIRAKWWPTVRTGDVNTQVWRLAQIGRLAKTGSLYRLNDPSAPNGGAAH